jgi:hypothetical protein
MFDELIAHHKLKGNDSLWLIAFAADCRNEWLIANHIRGEPVVWI